MNDPNENDTFLTNKFLKLVNQQAPLKIKVLRGNKDPFVDKQLLKRIYKRNKLRNICCKNLSKKNLISSKKQRNKCLSLRRRCIKDYLSKITKTSIATNKNFWKTIKPFLTNNGNL